MIKFTLLPCKIVHMINLMFNKYILKHFRTYPFLQKKIEERTTIADTILLRVDHGSKQ